MTPSRSDFRLEDVHAQLFIGLLQFGYQAARESGEQTVVHILEFYRRAVAGKDDASAVHEEVVEDVEEGVLGARLALPLLYVVDDEHVDGLVEEDEVVDGLAHHGIGVLYLKESCAHVEHALLGVFVAHVYADGIDEVGFSTARGTVDKHGVELAVVGVLGYRLSY